MRTHELRVHLDGVDCTQETLLDVMTALHEGTFEGAPGNGFTFTRSWQKAEDVERAVAYLAMRERRTTTAAVT